MSKPLLHVNDLEKVFSSRTMFRKKQVRAVRDVSFTLEAGKVLAIVGESGSGKSTIARMLTNLIPATSGDIAYNGQSLRDNRQLRKKLPTFVQMIFQDPFAALNPHHTIGYIIGRPLQVHRMVQGNTRSRVLALLRKVGLTPEEDFIDKYPYQLSGGQKQRVIIAKVLGLEPKVIIADEPTSMLDVSIGIDIMNLLLDLKEKENLALLMITHNLGSARYMADHIAVMYAGQVMEYGPAEELIQNPQHPYTKLLLYSSPDPWREQADHFDLSDAQGQAVSESCCSFQPRCPFATDICKTKPAAAVQTDSGHQVRCHLYA
ncbi:ABC transporter ATP-binding protein [Paenibacillus glycanilyticus]|uniref:Dipeptide/oligopeptide/nickel ABC transporter ATP-binding protein n=1 Tax=Paenibacillus glycanilyticus TaxID=126569 RepID=A0ABQ6G8Z8_9BACL|nr:ABC transporter ATP-binding protein [Paenibacillus glycanilyticus]GLX66740.1 dipeptide/oligopeptide/nickel ABC transporter ATP-binding protein [Paenibacillus glycanilyticus]